MPLTLGDSLAQGYAIGSSIRDRRDRREQQTLDNVFREKQLKLDEQKLAIQKRQEEFQLKKSDFDIRSNLIGMVQQGADPYVVGAQADLFFQTFGGDPKSEQAKEFKKALTKINEQTRASLINTLETIGPDLPPGTITNFAKTIATGRMTVPEAINALQSIGARASVKKHAAGGGTSMDVAADTGDLAAAYNFGQLEKQRAEIASAWQETISNEKFMEFLDPTKPDKFTNPAVISALDTTSQETGIDLSGRINSARRDPEHNAKVGGAKQSQHLPTDAGYGNAVDIDVSDLAPADRLSIANSLRRQGLGGFGFGTNIIHADAGPPRAWGYKNGKPNAPVPEYAKEFARELKSGSGTEDLPKNLRDFSDKINRLQKAVLASPTSPMADKAKNLITSLMNSPEGLQLKEYYKAKADTQFAGEQEEAKILAKSSSELKRPLNPLEKNLFNIKEDITVGELYNKYGANIPIDKEVIKDLQSSKAILKKMVDSASRVVSIAERNRAAVGTTGRLAGMINSFTAQLGNVKTMIPGFEKMFPEGSLEATEKAARGIIKKAGIDNAQLESEIINLAFIMAGLSGQSGHGVSNRDIEEFTRMIVAGGEDPDAIIGVIRAVTMAQTSIAKDKFEAATGIRPDIGVADNFSDLSYSGLKAARDAYKLLSPTQLSALDKEIDKRVEAALAKQRGR